MALRSGAMKSPHYCGNGRPNSLVARRSTSARLRSRHWRHTARALSLLDQMVGLEACATAHYWARWVRLGTRMPAAPAENPILSAVAGVLQPHSTLCDAWLESRPMRFALLK